MHPWVKHAVLPLLPTVFLLASAALPVETFGCAGRGFVALLVALGSELLSLGFAVAAIRARMRNEHDAALRRFVAALLLALPAMLLLILG